MKRSGGRLGVISKVGKGSTFWVELRMSRSPLSLSPTSATDLNIIGSLVVAFGVGAKAIVASPSYSGAQHAERKEAAGLAASNALAAGIMENATAGLPTAAENGKVGGDGGGLVSQTPSALQSLMEQGTPFFLLAVTSNFKGNSVLCRRPGRVRHSVKRKPVQSLCHHPHTKGHSQRHRHHSISR